MFRNHGSLVDGLCMSVVEICFSTHSESSLVMEKLVNFFLQYTCLAIIGNQKKPGLRLGA